MPLWATLCAVEVDRRGRGIQLNLIHLTIVLLLQVHPGILRLLLMLTENIVESNEKPLPTNTNIISICQSEHTMLLTCHDMLPRALGCMSKSDAHINYLLN